MSEQTKNLLIGIFVVAACALIISMTLFLKPKVGDAKQTILARFSDVNQLNIGTRVLFAGKPVGEVVAIDDIYDARQKPVFDLAGRIYSYQLVLKIDSHIKIYDTDKISIQTSGLLGEKSIAITPQKPSKGTTPKLVTNQPIYAESTDPIENAFLELSQLANDMEVTVQEITQWIQKNGDDLGNAIRSFGGAMDEAQATLHSVNERDLMADVQIGIQNFSQTMANADLALQQLQQGQVFVNAGPMMDNLKYATGSLRQITEKIASGSGTIGKLIERDDLYQKIGGLLSKVNVLMNDINHYGILFHLNKNWQRARQQRMVLLHSLDSPNQFKNYFEGEVDQIQTSMSRLSELVDKAESSPEKEKILDNEQFHKDFAELLRQADELSENLKLFNAELNSP